MTDDRFRTTVTLAETSEQVSFQDYFVRLRHGVPISGVHFVHDDAQLTTAARSAIEEADLIVIAPSNPLVSIGPIRALPDVDRLLGERREMVISISPIVGGAALKGPADRMLLELGLEPSVLGVAQLYAPISGALVIDPADAEIAEDVEAAGIRCVVEPSIMSDIDRARSLALACIAAV
jgi:LPPG:FO 2-phospho-L-lactate transferase